jgi:hypothetical protein
MVGVHHPVMAIIEDQNSTVAIALQHSVAIVAPVLVVLHEQILLADTLPS